MRDHAEVVADQEEGHALLAFEVAHQVEHLRLHRNVERRHRLVGDDQLRPRDQRARDGDALPLAAGEFVRIFFGIGGAAARLPPAARRRARARSARETSALRDERLGDDRLDPSGADRASRRDPGRSSAYAARAARNSRDAKREQRAAHRAAPRRSRAGRAPARCAPASTCRSRIRRRCRTTRPAATAKLTPSSARTASVRREQAGARQAIGLDEIDRFEKRRGGHARAHAAARRAMQRDDLACRASATGGGVVAAERRSSCRSGRRRGSPRRRRPRPARCREWSCSRAPRGAPSSRARLEQRARVGIARARQHRARPARSP